MSAPPPHSPPTGITSLLSLTWTTIKPPLALLEAIAFVNDCAVALAEFERLKQAGESVPVQAEEEPEG